MMGAFASRAASSAATIVDEEVTFYNPVRNFSIIPRGRQNTMAGIANFFSWQYLNSFWTSSPTMTPVFRLRTAVAILLRLSWWKEGLLRGNNEGMMRLRLLAGVTCKNYQGRVFEVRKYLNRCGDEEFGGAKPLRKDFCPREGDFHVIGS